MRVLVASEPGSQSRENEDWVLATPHVVAVLDGATARTDTGCIHGVKWYATKLGAAVVSHSGDTPLTDALAKAIADVAAMHPGCDLTHPGTPSAAAGVVRIDDDTIKYMVLGDVTVIAEVDGVIRTISDDRVSQTAAAERAEADRYPIGSPEKQAAMLRMKHVELAAKNRDAGYWVAETNPEAAQHALTGDFSLASVTRLAVLTDGAARALTFGLLPAADVLDLLDKSGPAALIDQVRAAEQEDPTGLRWARNKRSDDATAVYVKF
ncbi:hypothetical protein AB0B94_31070 [Micromonospora sp. NPDC048986]|uniref:hypothetical protein n=1 Tax=Micromonospora sp. NPDC048986 TaxID=3155644 RepID=UPI0033CAEDFE